MKKMGVEETCLGLHHYRLKLNNPKKIPKSRANWNIKMIKLSHNLHQVFPSTWSSSSSAGTLWAPSLNLQMERNGSIPSERRWPILTPTYTIKPIQAPHITSSNRYAQTQSNFPSTKSTPSNWNSGSRSGENKAILI